MQIPEWQGHMQRVSQGLIKRKVGRGLSTASQVQNRGAILPCQVPILQFWWDQWEKLTLLWPQHPLPHPLEQTSQALPGDLDKPSPLPQETRSENSSCSLWGRLIAGPLAIITPTVGTWSKATNFNITGWRGQGNEKTFQAQGLNPDNLWCLPGGSVVKNPPTTQETQGRSLGWEDPLEEEMATHSSVPAWKTPWTEEPGGLQSMGVTKRVRHGWRTKQTPIEAAETVPVWSKDWSRGRERWRRLWKLRGCVCPHQVIPYQGC